MMRKRIFDRYYWVDDINSKSIAAFGIGLYLCKEIIELHRGTIQVQGTKNEGILFSVVIPIDDQKS
jgi:two-component system sensor histidine kinase VicK